MQALTRNTISKSLKLPTKIEKAKILKWVQVVAMSNLCII
jgi:hypothetical protein